LRLFQHRHFARDKLRAIDEPTLADSQILVTAQLFFVLDLAGLAVTQCALESARRRYLPVFENLPL
jgi:hypothetical protein